MLSRRGPATIYGHDRKPIKVITVDGERVEEE
jgi:hypothetical protein